ncbi:MAG: hypothetical protein E7560_01380 [Ruminococcaceae bacterium]|nr:hypothetical protein [Oscillospiraceae bacterium]
MKRIISLFLSVFLVLTFSACNDKNVSSQNNESPFIESSMTDNSSLSANNQTEETPNNTSVNQNSFIPQSNIDTSKENSDDKLEVSDKNDDYLENKQENVDLRPEKITKTFDYQDNFRIPDKIVTGNFKDPDCNNTIPYTLYFPADYSPSKKYPVLFYLHGAGSRGSDNAKHLTQASTLFEVNGDLISQAFVICPQCPENGWWYLDKNYYGDNNGYLSTAVKLLQNVLDTYPTDRNRVYVTGLSMGGFGTWEALSRYSNLFAAGIPACGWGDSSMANILKEIPIWIFHGTADTTVSFQSSQSMFDAIKNAGGNKIHFTKLQNVGHDAWFYAFRDRKAISWLFSQNKIKNPAGNYEYISYLEVRDPDGNIIINENDFIKNRVGFLKDSNMKFTIILSENGTTKLSKAYLKYYGKEFKVLSGGKEIYYFTVTDKLNDDKFVIDSYFKFANYAGINRILNNYKNYQKS